MKWLIGYTYRFRSDRIVGGPDWLDSDQYDIVARSNRPDATMDSVNEMIKTLLADRFQLRAHVETRPADVYALVIAARDGRLGPSLKPSAGCAQGRVITSQPTFGDGKSRACGTRSLFDRGLVSIEAGGRPLADLVRSLDGNVGRPVVNKTGLTGLYDFDLRFTPSPAPGTVAEPGDVPEVFTALREQLGLALRSEPGSVDVLVIDHVEMPSPD